MLKLLEDLPVELVGTNVLGYLSLNDIVILERACGSKQSHQAFMEQIPHRPPIVFTSSKHTNITTLNWLGKRHCAIEAVTLQFSGENPVLHINKLKVKYFDLNVDSDTTIECLNPFLESNVGCKVRSITVSEYASKGVMVQLSACTGNVQQLTIEYSNNCMDWLTADILSRWKLKEISFNSCLIKTHFFIQIVQTCTELTSINLDPYNIDDSVVIAIAEHCTKLETLLLRSSNITWTSLLALAERGLPLKELDIDSIPNIPTTDIARRCSHALSCIRNLTTNILHQNGQDATILLPYMTGLTSVELNYYCPSDIHLLTQYCHKLTKIKVFCSRYDVADILPLCCANPLLQDIRSVCEGTNTDTTLIELIHACPHLHTLWLPNETDITDIGILALSQHCPQLQWLNVSDCKKVKEAAVLQLIQRCRKLTTLYVSSSSLSKETWTQLDKNTQKRVSGW